jgi:MFS family permease
MTESSSPGAPAVPAPIWQRKLLFAALYFSEGAPIGFIWVTIPVLLSNAGLPVGKIAWLSAVLIIPWTLKFLWAPLVDSLRTPAWGLRQWIYASQTFMGLSLLPLLWIDFASNFSLLTALLLMHGVAAATQDVAVDALCVASTTPKERGAFNGWMQVGVLVGRAVMGGVTLAMYGYLGKFGAVGILIGSILVSMALLTATGLPKRGYDPEHISFVSLLNTYWSAFIRKSTWWGILFALIAGASFKSFEALYPVFLEKHGIPNETIGLFVAGPMIGALVIGSLAGGWLADRVGPFQSVCTALLFVVSMIALLALYLLVVDEIQQYIFFSLVVIIGCGIGLFTSATYAMYMNLTVPFIAATQFSTFMGAVNGCESWSTYVLGRVAGPEGDGLGVGMLFLCAVSLLALPILWKTAVQLEDPELPLRST